MMKESDVEAVKRHNPGSQTQARIFSALAQIPPTEASWDAARAVLSGSRWQFSGDLSLDDTGDTAFAHTFTKGEIDQVISGIAHQQIKGAQIAIRRFENDEAGCTIVLSVGSASALRRLVPSMQLEGFSRSAGHVPTP